MASIKGPAQRAPGKPMFERLLPVLLRLVAVGTLVAAAALAAAAAGFRRHEMLALAAGIGAVLGLPTVLLLHRQWVERRAAASALMSAEARVTGIVDSAMDAIISVDEGQRIVLFNDAAQKVFGWKREEVLGRTLDVLLPPHFRAAHAEHVGRFGRTAVTSRAMGAQPVLHGLRKDGREFPVEASISQHAEDGHKLFTVILRDVTQRVRAEEELRRSREEIRALALVASRAREQEKSRVARELHDELGQALTALKIDVGRLREDLASESPEVRERLSSMQQLLDQTVFATRRISADLRPLVLDDLGLTAAVDWLAQNFRQRTGVPCELVMGQGDLDLADPHATAIFRVLQESLTNVARHAQAKQVEVVLERERDEVILTVSDNGRGFDPGATPAGSFGLAGVRERAELLSGAVSIDSTPGRGTRVELRLPLRAAQVPA